MFAPERMPLSGGRGGLSRPGVDDADFRFLIFLILDHFVPPGTFTCERLARYSISSEKGDFVEL